MIDNYPRNAIVSIALNPIFSVLMSVCIFFICSEAPSAEFAVVISF